MKKTILVTCFMVVFLFNLISATTENIFILTLKYDNGNISAQRLMVAEGIFNEPLDLLREGYKLEIISLEDEVLYSQKFNFQLESRLAPLAEWFDEEGKQIYFPNEEESKILLNQTTIELILPYFENVERIDIYDPNDNIELSIELKPDIEKSKGNLFYFLIGIIVLVVIILIVLIMFLIKRKKNNDIIKS